MGLALSSCPNSRSEDSDVENEASRRCFSRLLSERMSSGRQLCSWAQKHRQTATVHSLARLWRRVRGPHVPSIGKQGKECRQNITVMREILREKVVPPSVNMVSRWHQAVFCAKGRTPTDGGAVFPLFQSEVSETVRRPWWGDRQQCSCALRRPWSLEREAIVQGPQRGWMPTEAYSTLQLLILTCS